MEPVETDKKHYWLVFLILLAILLGAATGVLLIDTYAGEGKLWQQVRQYLPNTAEAPPLAEAAPKETVFDDTSEKDTTKEADFLLTAERKNTFALVKNEILWSSKDGVKRFKAVGEQKWNDTYTMTDPVLIQEGEMSAVGDLSGRWIRVYGSDGLLYSIQARGTVVRFFLNGNGYLGVISREENTYYVTVYNETGTELMGRVEESAGIFPLSMDISSDNRIFAVSYMDTTDIEQVAKVLFFYIREADGKEYTDSMFAAAAERPSEVIPLVRFMEGDVLVAVSDAGLFGYAPDGKVRWELPLENRIDFAAPGGNKYIVLLLGDVISGEKGQPEGTLLWVDLNGKTVGNFSGGKTGTYLSANADGAIAGYGHTYYGITRGGKVVWKHTATRDISDILWRDNLKQVLYVTKDEANMLSVNELVSEKENAPTNADANTKTNAKEDNKENKDASDVKKADEQAAPPEE